MRTKGLGRHDLLGRHHVNTRASPHLVFWKAFSALFELVLPSFRRGRQRNSVTVHCTLRTRKIMIGISGGVLILGIVIVLAVV
jgi:hypothetical protein